MNSTALGAGAEKAQEIIFISEAHEKFYYEKLKEIRYQDVYHKAGYSCAAEPPVQYRLSHLSRRSAPLIKHTICMMRVYSRNALSNPYTSRMEISCSASMLVMLMR